MDFFYHPQCALDYFSEMVNMTSLGINGMYRNSPAFICCSQFDDRLLSEDNRMQCVVCFLRTITWQLFQSVCVGGVLRCVK